MPEKAGSKKAAKKSASRKPAKKTAKKKVLGKKSTVKKAVKRKTADQKKAAVKKKAPVKKTAKKTIKKTTAKPKQTVHSDKYAVQPGPPPPGIPPVEEPARHDEAVGTVTHYYSHLGVAIVQINNGTLKSGDLIRIQGHTTDLTQPVESMELEHQHIDRAETGQIIGLRVRDHVRVHDIVYLTA